MLKMNREIYLMSNFLDDIKTLISRDLDTLSHELISYKSEENIWVIGKDIANTAGNLTLHVCGNLQHFIGTILGKGSYKRNREYEFSVKHISRYELLKEIEITKDTMKATLEKLTSDELQEDYPMEVLGYKMSTFYFLVHLQGHLNYHLGQINYHRRLLD